MLKSFLPIYYDPIGVKLLTRFRLKFSHLNEHKLRHGFGDTINDVCMRK